MPRSLLPSTRSRSTRIPPTPPLFPYTTLFRSLAGERGDRDRLGRDLALHIERAPPPDDVVWGRGALDMKSQVAAEAVAIASLARERSEERRVGKEWRCRRNARRSRPGGR